MSVAAACKPARPDRDVASSELLRLIRRIRVMGSRLNKPMARLYSLLCEQLAGRCVVQLID